MLSTPEFWVAASFVIFVLLAGRKAWATITGMLDARGARIARELDEARRLRAEAEAMMATARREREAASAEAAQMLERARADAARLTQSAAAEAQSSAARRERMAMDRIAAAEAGAVAEVRRRRRRHRHRRRAGRHRHDPHGRSRCGPRGQRDPGPRHRAQGGLAPQDVAARRIRRRVASLSVLATRGEAAARRVIPADPVPKHGMGPHGASPGLPLRLMRG
jgi:F-type H+-transporting ATPase subunit b